VIWNGSSPGKPPVKVGQAKRVRTFVAAAITGVLLFAMGLGFYLFQAHPPTLQPDPAVSTPAPIQASPQPLNRYFPAKWTINVNIYRDFTFQPTGFPLGLSVGQTTAGGLDTLSYEKLLREPNTELRKCCMGISHWEMALTAKSVSRWMKPISLPGLRMLTRIITKTSRTMGRHTVTRVPANLRRISGSDRDHHLAEETIIQPYLLWMWVTDSPPIVRFMRPVIMRGRLRLMALSITPSAFEQFKHNGLYRESGLWIDLNQDGKLDEQNEHFGG